MGCVLTYEAYNGWSTFTTQGLPAKAFVEWRCESVVVQSETAMSVFFPPLTLSVCQLVYNFSFLLSLAHSHFLCHQQDM